jgi:HSP20 family molecular chaperone IbpA
MILITRLKSQLAGFSRDDLEITAEGNKLIVTGKITVKTVESTYIVVLEQGTLHIILPYLILW